MKKGRITMTVTMGAICFILVYTIFMQFKTVEETDITQIESMRETELRESLASWKEKYEETNQMLDITRVKIDEYRQKLDANEEATELLEKELEEANKILGKTDVEGHGVIVTLSDNHEKGIEAKDLLVLINELRRAGAEAISINDERVISMTDIVERASRNILVNSQRVVSPYIVKAIGEENYLNSALSIKGGYIDVYHGLSKTVSIEARKNIRILKYDNKNDTDKMTLKYVK